MSKPRSTGKHGDNDAGGPGSSHQGGSHGQAHRERDRPAAKPGEPTSPERSRVSAGGGERDRHHAHDREKS